MPSYKKTPNAMRECVGPECGGCSSGNCYAKGGKVETGYEKGINRGTSAPDDLGTSSAGRSAKHGHIRDSKTQHKHTLKEMQSMPKPKLYAEGGSVDSWTKREDNEKGVHHKYLNKEGESAAGKHVRSGINSPAHDEGYSVRSAKREHEKVLGEMRGMKKPNLYADGGEVHDDIPEPDPKKAAEMQKGATSGGTSSSEAWANLKSGLGFAEGGEVEDGEGEMDSDLKQVMGDEFMSAIERKDKKAIMSTLEAIVLSCRGMK